MLGFSVDVYELAENVSATDLEAVRAVPYRQVVDFAQTFTIGSAASVAAPTWIGHLLDCTEDGRAQLVHDGGYPFLIRALGADIKETFSGRESAAAAHLSDEEWYLVEAWDQS